MEVIALISAIIDTVRLINFGYKLYAAARTQQNAQKDLLVRNYGWRLGVAVSLLLGDTAMHYYRIDTCILNGNDKDAIAFRKAITDECNMTAIAGAIIAQVAITGLSLPNLSSTHWVVHAFLLIAVVSGCLSVYYACVLQRIVGKLYQPSQVRDWLRLPPPSDTNQTDDLKASLTAVFIVSAPFTMVKVAIFSFLIGLAVYQGFVWTRALDTIAGVGASRNVFITLIVGTGFCIIFFVLTFAAKDIETLLRNIIPNNNPEHDPEQLDPRTSSQLQNHTNGLSQNFNLALPRSGADRANPGGLGAALEAAAKAHFQCAEADRLVAQEYTSIYNNPSNVTSNGHMNERSNENPEGDWNANLNEHPGGTV